MLRIPVNALGWSCAGSNPACVELHVWDCENPLVMPLNGPAQVQILPALGRMGCENPYNALDWSCAGPNPACVGSHVWDCENSW